MQITTIHYKSKHESNLPNNNSSFHKQKHKLIMQTTSVHYVNKHKNMIQGQMFQFCERGCAKSFSYVLAFLAELL